MDVSDELREADIEKYQYNLATTLGKFNDNNDKPITKAIIDAVFGDGGKSIRRLDKLISMTSPSYSGILQLRDWHGIIGISKLNLKKIYVYPVS